MTQPKDTSSNSPLLELAKRFGIETQYTDIWGNVHEASDKTCRAVLGAMGIGAKTKSQVEKSLIDDLTHCWNTLSEPVLTCSVEDTTLTLPIRVEKQWSQGVIPWEIHHENSNKTHKGTIALAEFNPIESHTLPNGKTYHRYEISIPVSLPMGYHQMVLTAPSPAIRVLPLMIVVAPKTSYMPEGLTGDQKTWGLATQLYAIRSKRNWGIGDFTDLLTLVDWCADHGAGVLGVNPIHELFPHNPDHASPYSPSSRLFNNIWYLDVTAIEGFDESKTVQGLVSDPSFKAQKQQAIEAPYVDYVAVAQLKGKVLRPLYDWFVQNHITPNTSLAQTFLTYCEEQGKHLQNLALFEALQAHLNQQDASIWGWPVWPKEYQDPQGKAVQDFIQTHGDDIRYYQYLQWQVDRQLTRVGVHALYRGLPIGLYMDLAIGSDRGGADVWANQDLYALDVSVGCPPDEFNLKGQDWGLPAMKPRQLRESHYDAFITMLRQTMRHGGALRLDHAMALMRLFWIPPGMTAAQGAYVYYNLHEYVAILALESHRNQCLVIGEDLGTVHPVVQETMKAHNIFSYKVFYFEKDENGFTAPEDYPPNALVTLSTHDLPTLKGYWNSRDVEIRDELDLFPNKASRKRMVDNRKQERLQMLQALKGQGLLSKEVPDKPEKVPAEAIATLTDAVHLFLAKTPSKVQMVQIEDLLGQIDQINLPATVHPTYPNWRRKITADIEALGAVPAINRLTAAMAQERPKSTPKAPSPSLTVQ